jgi:hypothetical protein
LGEGNANGHPQPRIAEFGGNGFKENAIGIKEEAYGNKVDEEGDADHTPT